MTEQSLEPDWVRHAIWWHLYPLGFTGADTSGADPSGPVQHRLTKLIDWLDYAVELGVSGLALGPIFASESHGYDTVDHYRIDPRLGDDADFDRLVDEAHRRGLKIMLDGVFNHVGRRFGAFTGEERDRWFVRDSNADDNWRVFEGHSGLVTLNHDSDVVRDYVTGVMSHWLDRGADAWRLDAAYAVPAAFWASVIPQVKAAHPACYVLGEVIHGDYAKQVADARLDSVTQYELWKAIWSSINDRNLFELSWAMKRHGERLGRFVPYTFVGNHDVTRIASRLTDPRHLAHALVVLFTIGGTPAVYYGDEQAFSGVKEDRVGGDDAVRPAFPTGPGDFVTDGWPIYRLHQDLIGLRRRHNWLHSARTSVVHQTNEQLVYDAVSADGTLRIVLNLADTELSRPAVGTLVAGTGSTDAKTTRVPPHGWSISEL